MCLSLLRFKKIIPVPDQSTVQMLCYLLQCLLTPEHTPADCAKELYELYLLRALTSLCVSVWVQLLDYRMEFSKWWVSEFKSIKFPSQGTVFDYYIDPHSKKFDPWSKMVPKFEMETETPLQGPRGWNPKPHQVCIGCYRARRRQRRQQPSSDSQQAAMGSELVPRSRRCKLEPALADVTGAIADAAPLRRTAVSTGLHLSDSSTTSSPRANGDEPG
ncbi:hypothetical protein F7725_021385 [Dissostichus mawsoni]|uniref:Dynein heavy chain AAA 5 extension domain-containing protein n=1 Tax=Dissostichus mawsoni TaxID=36200 RepID=A0A7J5ZB93_DISMA|nr:hypothetical protein F7725_021385 [Dissostichus mawsoni]